MGRPPLARFAFSFVIIGTFLAWEGYQSAQGNRGDVGTGRIALYLVGAMVCYVLGFIGIRQQHQK